MNFYMLEDPYAYRTARNIVEIGSFTYPVDFGADKRDARAGQFHENDTYLRDFPHKELDFPEALQFELNAALKKLKNHPLVLASTIGDQLSVAKELRKLGFVKAGSRTNPNHNHDTRVTAWLYRNKGVPFKLGRTREGGERALHCCGLELSWGRTPLKFASWWREQMKDFADDGAYATEEIYTDYLHLVEFRSPVDAKAMKAIKFRPVMRAGDFSVWTNGALK